jgi:hypothetical protein
MAIDPDDIDRFIDDLQTSLRINLESHQAEGAGLKLLKLMDLLDELRDHLHNGATL